jgi:hypothetical protein
MSVEYSGQLAAQQKDDMAASRTTNVPVVLDITLKSDVAAPFSPGLLSPAALSPPIARVDPSTVPPLAVILPLETDPCNTVATATADVDSGKIEAVVVDKPGLEIVLPANVTSVTDCDVSSVNSKPAETVSNEKVELSDDIKLTDDKCVGSVSPGKLVTDALLVPKDEVESPSGTVLSEKTASVVDVCVADESLPRTADDKSCEPAAAVMKVEILPKSLSSLTEEISPETSAVLDSLKIEPLQLPVVTPPATAPTPSVVSAKDETLGVASDSDISDLLSPGSPPDSVSLEDRIRALDEKLNMIQQTARLRPSDAICSAASGFDYSKYIRRRRINDGGCPVPTGCSSLDSPVAAASEPSDYVKSLLSRTSIFDQDSQRLEHSKYDVSSSSNLAAAVVSETRQRYSALRTAPSMDLSLKIPMISPSVVQPVYPSSADQVRFNAPIGYRQFDLNTGPLPSPGLYPGWS